MHVGLQVLGGTILAASEERAGRKWGTQVLVMNVVAAGIAFTSDFVAQVVVEGKELRLCCKSKKHDQIADKTPLKEGADEEESEEYRCTAPRRSSR